MLRHGADAGQISSSHDFIQPLQIIIFQILQITDTEEMPLIMYKAGMWRRKTTPDMAASG
jgi:hypothetical protein